MNAARLYWAQLEGTTKMFQTSEDKTQDGLDYIQNICCELINEFRCPRLVQIEARKLRSQCFPDTYWFAKFQLDQALDLIAKCEKDTAAGERDLAALAEVKQGVEAMLEGRTKSYEDEWKMKGRDPPTEDEWYDIADGEPGDGPEIFEPWGEPFKGSDWPFDDRRVDSSVLVGKTLPPPSRPRKTGPKDVAQEQQYDEEEDEHVIEAMELAMKEGAEGSKEVALKFRQLEISKGITKDDEMEMDVEGAPLSPADSEAGKEF